MMKLLRTAALLTAAALLTGCTLNINDVTIGHARKTVQLQGEDHNRIDPLLYAEEAGDHTLSVENIHFTNGGIEITIDPALEDTITLTGPEALLDTIKVQIDHEAGIISLRGNERLQFAGDDLEITLGVPVKSLTIAGGAELDARLPDVRAFTLRVDGAVDGDIIFGALDSLDVKINGAGSLELDGRCEKADISVNGAGNLEADDLLCANAAVTINGAGSCEIHVTGTLDAEVNGIGSIRYRGNPAQVNKSGGGIVAVGEQ